MGLGEAATADGDVLQTSESCNDKIQYVLEAVIPNSQFTKKRERSHDKGSKLRFVGTVARNDDMSGLRVQSEIICLGTDGGMLLNEWNRGVSVEASSVYG